MFAAWCPAGMLLAGTTPGAAAKATGAAAAAAMAVATGRPAVTGA